MNNYCTYLEVDVPVENHGFHEVLDQIDNPIIPDLPVLSSCKGEVVFIRVSTKWLNLYANFTQNVTFYVNCQKTCKICAKMTHDVTAGY